MLHDIDETLHCTELDLLCCEKIVQKHWNICQLNQIVFLQHFPIFQCLINCVWLENWNVFHFNEYRNDITNTQSYLRYVLYKATGWQSWRGEHPRGIKDKLAQNAGKMKFFIMKIPIIPSSLSPGPWNDLYPSEISEMEFALKNVSSGIPFILTNFQYTLVGTNISFLIRMSMYIMKRA